MSRIIRDTQHTPIVERPKLPRAGHVKIGQMVTKKDAKGNQIQFPQSLEYFIVNNYQKAFRDYYGDKPTEIDIVFFDERDSISCSERYEWRDGQVLMAYGDGKVFYVRNKQNNQFEMRLIGDSDGKQYVSWDDLDRLSKKREETLTMRFLIYPLNIFGFFEFVTKAVKTTMPEVIGTYDTVKKSAGRVSLIPFKLVSERISSAGFQEGNKVTRNFTKVSLIPQLGAQDLAFLSQNLTRFDVGAQMIINAEELEKMRIQGGIEPAQTEIMLSPADIEDAADLFDADEV